MHRDRGRLFTAVGHPPGDPLGRGMEGVVHRLGDGLVGKAWSHRTVADLRPLRDFYDELATQRLPFDTPRIVELHGHDGRAVSIERELPGTPLTAALTAGGVSAEAGADAVVHVVTAQAATVAGPAARALATLDEDAPLWTGHEAWGPALAGLVHRRATRFRGPLGAAIPDFDATLERVLLLLARLPPAAGQVIHGDICPENILVDATGVPVSVSPVPTPTTRRVRTGTSPGAWQRSGARTSGAAERGRPRPRPLHPTPDLNRPAGTDRARCRPTTAAPAGCRATPPAGSHDPPRPRVGAEPVVARESVDVGQHRVTAPR